MATYSFTPDYSLAPQDYVQPAAAAAPAPSNPSFIDMFKSLDPKRLAASVVEKTFLGLAKSLMSPSSGSAPRRRQRMQVGNSSSGRVAFSDWLASLSRDPGNMKL